MMLMCAMLAAASTHGAPLAVTREAFWLTPPKADPQTMALWSFDDNDGKTAMEGIADDDFGDLLTAAALGTGPKTADLPQTGRIGGLAGFEAVGNVKTGVKGFFGKGVLLERGGLLRSQTVAFGEAAQSSIELQFCPRAMAGESVVLDFPAARIACRVVRGNDGTISLEGRNGARVRSPRLAPAERWTHVAVSFARNGGISLLVNGTVSVPDESQRPDFPAAPAQLGNVFTVGAATAGFVGTVDTVRVLSRAASLYELEEMPQAGRDLPPPAAATAPWFAYSRGPLFMLDFDATADIDGIRGAAALPQKDDLLFSGAGVLPATGGTLSLWFRPRDWDNLTEYDQYGNDGPVPQLRLLSFVPAGTPDGYALRTLTLGKGIQQPQLGLPKPWTPFHPGRWVHLVCAWNGKHTTIYIDGKKQALGQVGWTAAGRDKETRKKIEEAWNSDSAQQMNLIGHNSGTAIDMLAVYPWCFTDQEAANDYNRFFPDSATRLVKLEPVDITPQYDYYRRRLEVIIHALPQSERQPDRIRLTIGGGASKAGIATVEAALPANGRTNLTMAATLDFDREYAITAETFFEGRSLARSERTYKRQQPAWWRNTLGKSDEVPAPWEPIATTDTMELNVWGRSIRLAPGGLPAAITSAGAELLAGPLRLHGELADGAPFELGGAVAPDWSMTSARLVRWSGALKGNGMVADVVGEMEYDGLIRLRLTLRPGAGDVTIKRLDLDTPLRSAHAIQIIANGGGGNFRASWDARLIPAGNGLVWNSREAIKHKGVAVGHFLPMVWLGDDWRGLCFFGENDRGWTPQADEAAQEVWRREGQIIYRMRLISRELVLTGSREIEFFIHPTPTKPLPAQWRAFNRGAPPVPNYEGIDAFISPTLTVPANLPSHAGITFGLEPHSWEDAAANSETLRQRAGAAGSPRLFYIDCSWPRLGDSMAEFTRAGLFARGRMTWTPEVEDYMVWTINGYIRRDLIDGIYIDDTSFSSTILTNSTAYRLDNGTVQPGFNTMGFRRFLQRIWSLYAAEGKRARIIPHMTYCYEIPALSFADAVVNGEDRDIYPYDKRTFPELWPFEQLRALAGSEKFGFVHFWKAGVDGEKAATPRGLPQWLFWQNRAMKGWLMLQDTEVMWGAKIGARELLAFGAAESDTRFIHPEEAADWFDDVPRTIRLAAYLRERRALLVLFNQDKEEVSLKLKPNTGGFFRGRGQFAWRDAESDILPPGGGALSADDLEKAKKIKESSLSFDAPTLDNAALDDLLDPKSPEDKERERLAVKTSDGHASLLVRGNDFRLLLLTWQETGGK